MITIRHSSLATPRARPRQRAWFSTGVFGLLAMLAICSAHAQTNLYEGEVAVGSQSANVRNAVLPEALAAVLVKLSGDRHAAELPSVRARLPDARLLMQQFRYRQDLDMIDGSLQQQLYLVVGFDPDGVHALMADAGLPLWPSPRAALMLWLAIDDGSGARLVAADQATGLKPLTDSAERRGINLEFPLLDAEDRAQVAVNDVLLVRQERLDAASLRYQAEQQLIGELVRGGNGWRAAWTLRDNGQTVDSWQQNDVDPAVLLAAGVDRAADALAVTHAKPIFVGEPLQLRVAINGINNADDYARALAFLRGLSIVRSAIPQASSGQRLVVAVQLAAEREALLQAVAASDVLQLLQTLDHAPPGLVAEPNVDIHSHIRP